MSVEPNDLMDDGMATLIPPPREEGESVHRTLAEIAELAMGTLIPPPLEPTAHAAVSAPAVGLAMGTLLPPPAEPETPAMNALAEPAPLAIGTLLPPPPAAARDRDRTIVREPRPALRAREGAQIPGKATQVELEAAPATPTVDLTSAAAVLRKELVAAMEAHRTLAALLSNVDPATLAAALHALGADHYPELIDAIVAAAGDTVLRFHGS